MRVRRLLRVVPRCCRTSLLQRCRSPTCQSGSAGARLGGALLEDVLEDPHVQRLARMHAGDRMRLLRERDDARVEHRGGPVAWPSCQRPARPRGTAPGGCPTSGVARAARPARQPVPWRVRGRWAAPRTEACPGRAAQISTEPPGSTCSVSSVRPASGSPATAFTACGHHGPGMARPGRSDDPERAGRCRRRSRPAPL